jgi:hypothetical protein
MANGDSKVVKAPRKSPQAPAKNSPQAPTKTTVARPDKPSLWVKIYDANDPKDPHTPVHVDPQQVRQALEDGFKWLSNFGIDLKVEVGLFTPEELAAIGPEWRNQVALCSTGVGLPFKDKNTPTVRYFDENVANLVETMWQLDVLNRPDPEPDTPDAGSWPSIARLATWSWLGDTIVSKRFSAVEYWHADVCTASQNEDWKKHPGEWEAHVSEHEIGHTFGFDHADGGSASLPNAMHIGFYEYQWSAHLNAKDISDEGGSSQVMDQFHALPNAAGSSWVSKAGGFEDLSLSYKGYPGFSTDQRATIAKMIRDKRKEYDHATKATQIKRK